MDKATQVADGVVPVGSAIEDMHVLLVDETGKEVGANQIGEIVVHSPYLSPGYWRQPELTRAVFVPAPAAADTTMYRTGDMGYMRPDGCLVHLGRKDSQAKMRGYRVDVGDIESALLTHPAVRETAVMVRAQTPEEPRLVAYIAVHESPPPTSSSFRRFLEARLPAYMVPADFVQLAGLPRTPNGKVDRQALPAPERVRPVLDTPFVAPRSALEKRLAHLWGNVLEVACVGIHDTFFDLGGHSLLANKIISQAADIFHVEITFRDFFELPTIAHMAETIYRKLAEKIEDTELCKMLLALEALSSEEARQALKEERA
jgi:hypothetical protein